MEIFSAKDAHNMKVKAKIKEEISKGKENQYSFGLIESKSNKIMWNFKYFCVALCVL